MTDNGPVGAREERFAANEALFREVNERVAELASQYVGSDPVTPSISRASAVARSARRR
jgi:hypothetical protein